jgi:hypothetical protein
MQYDSRRARRRNRWRDRDHVAQNYEALNELLRRCSFSSGASRLDLHREMEQSIVPSQQFREEWAEIRSRDIRRFREEYEGTFEPEPPPDRPESEMPPSLFELCLQLFIDHESAIAANPYNGGNREIIRYEFVPEHLRDPLAPFDDPAFVSYAMRHIERRSLSLQCHSDGWHWVPDHPGDRDAVAMEIGRRGQEREDAASNWAEDIYLRARSRMQSLYNDQWDDRAAVEAERERRRNQGRGRSLSLMGDSDLPAVVRRNGEFVEVDRLTAEDEHDIAQPFITNGSGLDSQTRQDAWQQNYQNHRKGKAMDYFADPDRRTAWLTEHGYSDAFQNDGQWWAFPPNGVIPVPLWEAFAP